MSAAEPTAWGGTSIHYRVVTRCETYGHSTPCVDCETAERIVAVRRAEGYDAIKLAHCSLATACYHSATLPLRRLNALTEWFIAMHLRAPRYGARLAPLYIVTERADALVSPLAVTLSPAERAIVHSIVAQRIVC